MRRFILVGAALSLFIGGICTARSVNAIKSTRISTTTLVLGCEDEREPVVTKLADTTTAIVVTCKLVE